MKAQLFAVLILIGSIPMIIFSVVMISTYNQQAHNQRVSELKYHGNMIANLLVSTGYFSSNSNSKEVDTEIDQVAEIYDGRIVVVDSGLHIVKDTYGLEEGKTIISEEVIKCFRGTNSTYVEPGQQFVEITIPITHLETKEVIGVIVMSFSTKNIIDIKKIVENKAIVLTIALVIAVVMFSIIYAIYATKPFKKVTNSLDRMTEGYLDEKLAVSGYTEMKDISESFNHMIARMQKLEKSRQEFVSNVSHELKTPITSIKVLADSLIMQEDAPVEMYREFMVDITEEIERENKIINDLLSLVKMDKTAGEMNITSISINELLEQLMKRLRPIAAKRNIEVVLESYRPVVAEVDEVKLSLAISNLIENAIKYNVDEGWVRVSLNADHKFFYIKVADSGVGIPEDAQDFIFERFYRVDKARSRETGGTGLGLSIARNAVLMHRGAIKVYSKINEGTTFTVRIPLSYIA
ncbi:sensor histidine kinase [Anaerosporobacter faecicola]|uniref:sensor histidine kinase n=1 Tax=Anaerosporobacter faecicola TaxID=2718714 RepID=UPI001438CE94|nr:HAMP domain-containing sensor histidine kinase [Anaerosporobacter faecicola]